MYCRKMLVILGLLVGSVSAFSGEPSLLELKVMQSREFSMPEGEILTAIEESCRARGGQLAGYYNPNAAINAGQKKMMSDMTSQNLRGGNIICINYGNKLIEANGISMVSFRIQGGSAESGNFLIRLNATGFFNDGKGGKSHGPINSPEIYDFIFKDISEISGTMSIPIKVKMAD